ncbi:uncharacterized protein KQ657_001550 [Scheffersomyces spartinae]|uniref:Opaque-phase-specific protein OP4 n=1 Tax=Scheffersomyces spartinae TaxID=45513 RepID=A0A9P7V7T1_9ASCO|nr:uncharacterized protein KQ657_001550 [Scheffersomyces spartinae]KAG7192767.1 hypothetical protein KQ657_001550 [Scheffersomyces spartinae]
MRFTTFIPVAVLGLAASAQASAAGTEFDLEEQVSHNIKMVKRAGSAIDESTIESLLLYANKTNLIVDAAEAFLDNSTNVVLLSQVIVNALNGTYNNLILTFAGSGSLNISSILHVVEASGLIQTTSGTLLIKDYNRNRTADMLGQLLVDQIWIPKLLKGLGDGHDLTFDYIFKLVNESKASTTNGNSKQTVLGKREDTSQYAGSANTFFYNLVSQLTSSELFLASVSDILKALNNTNVAPYIIMDVLNSTTILSGVGQILTNVYDTGALKNIDLNSYFVEAKKSNMLSDLLQKILTDPVYSPYLGKLFQRMELEGYYRQIQHKMYPQS